MQGIATAQKLYRYLGYDGRLFGTQQVVEYEEEARHGGLRSHRALTYDHSGAIGTWSRRCASRRRCSRNWTRA